MPTWKPHELAFDWSGLTLSGTLHLANSGPSINVPEQNLYGCEHTMRLQGHPEAAPKTGA